MKWKWSAIELISDRYGVYGAKITKKTPLSVPDNMFGLAMVLGPPSVPCCFRPVSGGCWSKQLPGWTEEQRRSSHWPAATLAVSPWNGWLTRVIHLCHRDGEDSDGGGDDSQREQQTHFPQSRFQERVSFFPLNFIETDLNALSVEFECRTTAMVFFSDPRTCVCVHVCVCMCVCIHCACTPGLVSSLSSGAASGGRQP